MVDPKGNKRNSNPKIAILADKRQERLTRVAALYVQGRHSLREIARRCGELTVRQIRRDLDHIRKMWADSASEDLKFYLSKELARIDLIEGEAWREWEKSCQPEVETAIQIETASQSEGGQEPQKIEKRGRKKKYSSGNPAFLSQMLGCVDRRMRLLGLDDRTQGGADDIQVQAVEVICDDREQAMAMIEFEEFRTLIKR